jgi:DNA-binding Lrp family transcriptional regulator
MPQSHIDELDRLIIKFLRENARIPNTELARRVGLSESQCLRRLHALERGGTIRQYKAVVDSNAVGLPIMAHVEVQLACPTRERVRSFERAVDARPEITECWRTSGDSSYFLRASVADLPTYERLITEVLTDFDGAKVVRTHLALRNVKASTVSLPLAAGDLSPLRLGSTGPAIMSLAKIESRRQGRPDGTSTLLSHAELPGYRRGAKSSKLVDQIDLRILKALSFNARIANVDLAEHVGLSPAACLRRVRALEKKRVIRYYLALVDYATFNMFVVFIQLRLDRATRD